MRKLQLETRAELVMYALANGVRAPNEARTLATRSASIGVASDDPIITGKIALAHMKEFADHYEPLERMEREAERDPSGELESEPGGSAL